MTTAIVIGGGIAGIAAATALTDAGVDTTVLEAGDRPGGKLRQGVVGGVTTDVGAESFLATRPEVRDLAAGLGLAERITSPATMAASIFANGQRHPLPSPSLMGIPARPDDALGLLSAAEVERLRNEPRALAPTHDVSVGSYLTQQLGSAAAQRLVGPLLSGVYAGRLDELSLQAATPRLWDVATAGTRLTDAAAHLRPADGTRAASAFAGMRGGMGQFALDAAVVLGERGVTWHYNTESRQLRRDGTSWVVPSDAAGESVDYRADLVVVAVPASAASALLLGVAPGAAATLAAIDAASIAITTLAFDRDALAASGTLPGSGILVSEDAECPIKAATFSSSKWSWLRDRAPSLTLLRTSIGRAGDGDLQRTDEQLVDDSLVGLAQVLQGDLPPPVDASVQRWDAGLPQYRVGHVDAVAAVRRDVAQHRGLAICGAVFDGVGIAAVIGSAHAAVTSLTQA